jgi:hypothetical protein
VLASKFDVNPFLAVPLAVPLRRLQFHIAVVFRLQGGCFAIGAWVVRRSTAPCRQHVAR